jgi:hypothetical protein
MSEYYDLYYRAVNKLKECENEIEKRDDTISTLTKENAALKVALADRNEAAMVRIARAIVKYSNDPIIPERDARLILGRPVDFGDGRHFTNLNALVALHHEHNVKHFQRTRRQQKECVRLQQFADRQVKFERLAWARLAAILARKERTP